MLSAFSGKDTENGYMLLIRSCSVRQSPLLALSFFAPYLISISAYEVSQLCMVTVLGYKASVCLKLLKTNKWETFSVLKPLSPYTLIQSLSPEPPLSKFQQWSGMLLLICRDTVKTIWVPQRWVDETRPVARPSVLQT